MPGAKEARTRAEAIQKRRAVAAARVSDLNTEYEDLNLALELEKPEYRPADLSSVQAALTRARGVLDNLFQDINEIQDHPVPERITDRQAFELIQPALRIESRDLEMRRWLEETRRLLTELGRPRQSAAGSVNLAQNRRLQIQGGLVEAQGMVEALQQFGAENHPETAAALLTANREYTTAAQLLEGARQALLQKGYREAEDLASRAGQLLESSSRKLDLIRLVGAEVQKAPGEAETQLEKALAALASARQYLANQSLPGGDPNSQLFPAIQRIGQARQAIKSNPPQYLTCLKLSREALSLIESLLEKAREDAHRLNTLRGNAQAYFQQLEEAVHQARLTLNNQRRVPVRANELYSQAREMREKFLAESRRIEQLEPARLAQFLEAVQEATLKAQEAVRLASDSG